MQIYLVGGAVRDQLLGLEVKDRDWVVVGATPEAMVEAGYRPVGKDFPVFLHPETHEEYALARTERKSGKGYKGFTFHTSPDVTLEQDLIRRDLRINAMAMSEAGEIIDPYGGQADLDARKLSHVSDAFSEDPLRVLRVARFAARFAPLGFSVASETLELMQQLSSDDELQHLSAERVWQEFERALNTATPATFLEVLHACGALTKLMPELAENEAESWQQLNAETLNLSTERFAVLAHQITEQKSEAAVEAMAQRLRIPKRYTEVARDLHQWGEQLVRFAKLKPQAKLQLIEGLKLQRSEQRLAPLQAPAELIHNTHVDRPAITQAIAAVTNISPKILLAEGFSGPALGEELRRRQIHALDSAL